MLNLSRDYSETGHPALIQALLNISYEQNTAYGFDKHSENAKKLILEECGCPDGEVKFLPGGTCTNKAVIAAMLHKYQGVIAVETGHIAQHESGAIENAGHKVLTIPGVEGKMKADTLEGYLKNFYADGDHEHMVIPGMVYISFPTEYGTVYNREELAQIRQICDRYKLKLYIDGARLGYGLAAKGNDVTLKDMAKYAHTFYIGGTKQGAMFGEAVVVPDKNTIPHFFSLIKQQGALFAKGWIAAVQFETLFTDDMYMKLSRHAVDKAMEIKDILTDAGVSIYINSPTNQQFFIMDDETLSKLDGKVDYSYWQKLSDGNNVIRLAASWATTDEEIEQLKSIMK